MAREYRVIEECTEVTEYIVEAESHEEARKKVTEGEEWQGAGNWVDSYGHKVTETEDLDSGDLMDWEDYERRIKEAAGRVGNLNDVIVTKSP